MTERSEKTVIITGAGLSGLSAAITLAEQGIRSELISSQPSERAQSVLAEGGINAALDTMGESDSTDEHFADTMKGGCYLESDAAVKSLTENAPDVVRWLDRLGVPFNAEDGRLVLRNFGGQKKKRTAYAKSSTGKMLMTALIDEVRKYEEAGMIHRWPHHELIKINTENNELKSLEVRDSFTGEQIVFTGTAILCTGGLNGFFEGMTTGTTQNTGNAAALAFAAGAEMADLEFIQYHPTTVEISNKRMLISEAARGEGGRLYTVMNGEPWYFMEEKYPELGNLMPRDVVSREIAMLSGIEGCSGEVYLDMTELDDAVWQGRLSDLREEIISYLHTDPAAEPVRVRPGIHFFMGGIRTGLDHSTSIKGLYAAGEAACRYHGANRLGGNSLLGAIHGGKAAAAAAALRAGTAPVATVTTAGGEDTTASSPESRERIRDILLSGLGILRNKESMEAALSEMNAVCADESASQIDRERAMLGKAMLMSALAREESRGAHYRTDYPDTDEAYRKLTIASYRDGDIQIHFASADKDPGEEWT